MMNFCTLFDSNYISKGIALFLSIEKYTKDFTFYVMAMDRKCQELLNTIGFEGLIVDCIEDINDLELMRAKGNRSRVEFCWTCGSYTTDYFMHKYDLLDITYLDSDLMFFCSPRVVFDELERKNASVGLAPHFTNNPLFGRYCVQYVYFKNDEDGRDCLRWWKDNCLKWCYAKAEDGKFGDQKYLDYFSEKFNHVCDIENRGVGIAYWNMNHNRYVEGKVIYKNEEWPQVFFHYSGFNVSVNNGEMVFKHTMYLTPSVFKTFVAPYMELMKEVFSRYLSTPINRVVVTPLNRWNHFVKTIAFFLNYFLPIDWCIEQVMKVKYRKSHKLYSEI